MLKKLWCCGNRRLNECYQKSLRRGQGTVTCTVVRKYKKESCYSFRPALMKTLGRNVKSLGLKWKPLISCIHFINQSNAKLGLKMSSETTTNKCQCYLKHISENLWLASWVFNQKSLEKSILTGYGKNKSPSEEKLPYLKVPLHGAINKIQRFFVILLPFVPVFFSSVLNVLTLTPCLGKL